MTDDLRLALEQIDEFCNKVNGGVFDPVGTIQAIQHTARAALRSSNRESIGVVIQNCSKAELLKALEPFADDQLVFIDLHSDDHPRGCHLQIAEVREVQVWNLGQAGRKLVGLICHDWRVMGDDGRTRSMESYRKGGG